MAILILFDCLKKGSSIAVREYAYSIICAVRVVRSKKDLSAQLFAA